MDNNDDSDLSNQCTKRCQQQQQQSVDETASNVEQENIDQDEKANPDGDNSNQNPSYLPWMGRLLWTGTTATASVGATAIKSVASGTYTVGSTVASYIPGSSWFKGKDTNDSIEKSNLQTDPLAAPTNENSNNLNATGTSASSKSASTSKWSLKQKNKSD